MTDKSYDELTRELVQLRERMKYEERVGPEKKKRRGLAAFKFEVLALALVLTSVGVLASFVLFSQKPTYSSLANISTGCATPSGAAQGSLIIFSCPAAAIHVSSAAAGTVTYSSFSPPSNITDAYLVDAAVASGTTCASWLTPGNEPIHMVFAGGSIPIGTVVGDLRPSHGYFYCMDFSTAPPTFNVTIDWTQ